MVREVSTGGKRNKGSDGLISVASIGFARQDSLKKG